MGRTNIVLDEGLVREAMRVTGARTKREVVDVALRDVVRRRQIYQRLLSLRGKLRWSGDLAAMRRDRI